MTEKYSTKNYKPGYSPARLQHNFKMTYENAYNLAQDLNNVFNRLYTVEQEKKEYRKENARLRQALGLMVDFFEEDWQNPGKNYVYVMAKAKEALKGGE